jgi:prolipoprotein diacylglyceryltransferase
MFPELIEIPFIHVTVKSHGLMIIIGFLLALVLARRLSRSFTAAPQLMTNGGLYCLIGGVVGARIHFVVHYAERGEQGEIRYLSRMRVQDRVG